MTTAKVQLTIGDLTFSGEGTEAWLEKQINKFLSASGEPGEHGKPAGAAASAAKTSKTAKAAAGTSPPLRSYLDEKKATANQVRKFLATVQWLHDKGSNRLKSANVIKALSDANQKKLGNAADCLNQNVGKGHCEKEAGQFFVTDEGRTALGK